MADPYDFCMMGIWQRQMSPVWYAYGIHMATPYGCHMDTIQQAYIDLLTKVTLHAHYMQMMWYQYSSYMVCDSCHINGTQQACEQTIWLIKVLLL